MPDPADSPPDADTAQVASLEHHGRGHAAAEAGTISYGRADPHWTFRQLPLSGVVLLSRPASYDSALLCELLSTVTPLCPLSTFSVHGAGKPSLRFRKIISFGRNLTAPCVNPRGSLFANQCTIAPDLSLTPALSFFEALAPDPAQTRESSSAGPQVSAMCILSFTPARSALRFPYPRAAPTTRRVAPHPVHNPPASIQLYPAHAIICQRTPSRSP